MPNYKRGEIWWVDLNPTIGSEAGKIRPCLILQNDVGNQSSTTTIVAPFMPGSKTYPFTVNVVPTAQNGLDKDRYINLSQLRVVSEQRVSSRLGKLEDAYWKSIEKAVNIELGFGSAFS